MKRGSRVRVYKYVILHQKYAKNQKCEYCHTKARELRGMAEKSHAHEVELPQARKVAKGRPDSLPSRCSQVAETV
jgi:hypothetical protein